MVGPHIADHPALDHRDRVPAEPHILPDQRTAAGVVLSDLRLKAGYAVKVRTVPAARRESSVAASNLDSLRYPRRLDFFFP